MAPIVFGCLWWICNHAKRFVFDQAKWSVVMVCFSMETSSLLQVYQWLICWFMLVVVPVSFEEEYSQGNT